MSATQTIINQPTDNKTLKTKLEWALHFASLGMPIHRLVHTNPDGSCTCGSKPDAEGKLFIPGTKDKCSPGKHPLPSVSWKSDRTTDEAKIRKWFKDDPAMNYGVSAGNGFTIIDPDMKDGKNGIRSLADMLDISESHVSMQTFTALTPTGGLHLYYKDTEDRGNRAGLKHSDSGIDVKGVNGYVVGIGSTIHIQDEFGEWIETPYSVLTDIPMTDIPLGIAKWLRIATERDPNAGESLRPGDVDSDSAVALARAFLKNRKPAVEGEAGNNHTYTTAAYLREHNISEDMCFEIMTEAGGWNERCEPEWDHEELKGVISNAYNYAKKPMGNVISLMDYFGDDDVELPEVSAAKAREKEPRYKIYSDGEGSTGLPVEWLIKGVLARGYQTLIYGDEQVLKTFIALEMVLCAITGKPFLPVKDVPDSGYPVSEPRLTALYICGEGWRGVQMQKVPLWKDHHGIPADKIIPFHSMDVMPCVLDDQAVKDLADSIKMQFAGRPLPDIIVIDTVVYAITPLGKEDSNDDATKMYAAGNRLMELLGKKFAPIWIHHEGHSAERARGASNITKSSDVRYRCAHKTDPRFTGDKDHPSARSYHVLMTCEKFKDTDLPQPVEIKGRTIYGMNSEGHHISSVILEGVQSASDRVADQMAKDAADDEIRELVAGLFVTRKVAEASINLMAGWCSGQVKGAPSGSWLDPKAPASKRHFEGELKTLFIQPYQTPEGGWITMGDATGSGGGKALIFTSAEEAA